MLERFLRYVRIDTQSAARVDTLPEHGEAARPVAAARGRAARARPRRGRAHRARLRASRRCRARPGPTVGLLAHVDTSPDAPGDRRRAAGARDYDGGELVRRRSRPRRARCSPSGSGTTSSPPTGRRCSAPTTRPGVAEIMAAAAWLVAHPDVPRAPRADRVHRRRGGRPRHRPLRPRARSAPTSPTPSTARSWARSRTRRSRRSSSRSTFHGVGVHPGRRRAGS